MATVSAVMTTLFLGGYHAIWPFGLIIPDTGYWGMLWFVIKVQLLISVFVWLRGTLPRLRYDQFMDLGWKWMIPISIAWIMIIATFRALMNEGLFQGPLLWIALGVVLLGLLAAFFLGGEKVPVREAPPEGEFDAFAGGYPVPPMPGQVLPELADVVSVPGDRAPGTASDHSPKEQ
jgi:NADH-quinone oxidoreductase subunit H